MLLKNIQGGLHLENLKSIDRGKGVFSSFSTDNVKKWTEIVEEGYPEFAGQFQLFGYDWLGRCIGYKIPLFLGGEDVIVNLEDSDMEVYWYIVSEIKKRSE